MTVATKLSGEELFTFTGRFSLFEQKISAEDFKLYVGGDKAAPSLRPERGAHSTKLSDFPNAERPMGDGDRITGMQGGLNVNFALDQIVRGASGTFESADGKIITVENGLITSID